jgi:hypothetical protein
MKLLLFHVVNTVAMREHGRKVHAVEFSLRHRLDPILRFRQERIKVSGHYADTIELGHDDDVLRRYSGSLAWRMQKKLAAGKQPDFRTISDFRKQPLGAQQGLFDQVLQIVLQAGTMKLGRVVLDGSKVKANASKHKAVS